MNHHRISFRPLVRILGWFFMFISGFMLSYELRFDFGDLGELMCFLSVFLRGFAVDSVYN